MRLASGMKVLAFGVKMLLVDLKLGRYAFWRYQ